MNHLISIFAFSLFLLSSSLSSAQYHRHHQHGTATTRHCQTDYDHRAHYYHSRSHFHYCPGGAHEHHGHGHVHRGKRYPTNHDPVVEQIQQRLVQLGLYDHGHHQTDGIYGPETAEAIRRYQTRNDLPVTGTINDELLKSMGISSPAYGDATQAGKPAAAPAISVPPGYKVVTNADGSLSVVPE